MRKFRLAVTGILIAGLSHAALAQYVGLPDVLGQVIGRATSGSGGGGCGSGMPVSEQQEARAPSIAVMQAYFAAASAHTPISPFFKLTRKTRWTSGEITVDRAALNQQIDPLAVPGNRFDPQPLRAFRAGTFSTAVGQWAVYGTDGSIAGVYTALFEREGSIWKIRELDVLGPDEELVPVDRYCSEPGDLIEADIQAAETWKAYSERQLERKQAEFEREDTAAREAEVLAAAQPESSRVAANALRLRERALHTAEEVAQAERNVVGAKDQLARSQSAMAEFRQLIGPVRNAEQIRLLPDS